MNTIKATQSSALNGYFQAGNSIASAGKGEGKSYSDNNAGATGNRDTRNLAAMKRANPSHPQGVGAAATDSSAKDTVSLSPMTGLTNRVTQDVISEVFVNRFGPTSQKNSGGGKAGDFSGQFITKEVVRSFPQILEAYAQANPQLSGMPLLDNFSQEVQGGLGEAYEQADNIMMYVGNGNQDYKSILGSNFSRISTALDDIIQTMAMSQD